MTILVKFSPFRQFIHKLKEKIGTLKNTTKLLTLVFKTAFLLKLVSQKFCFPELEPVAGTGPGASQDWIGSTTL